MRAWGSSRCTAHTCPGAGGGEAWLLLQPLPGPSVGPRPAHGWGWRLRKGKLGQLYHPVACARLWGPTPLSWLETRPRAGAAGASPRTRLPPVSDLPGPVGTAAVGLRTCGVAGHSPATCFPRGWGGCPPVLERSVAIRDDGSWGQRGAPVAKERVGTGDGVNGSGGPWGSRQSSADPGSPWASLKPALKGGLGIQLAKQTPPE